MFQSAERDCLSCRPSAPCSGTRHGAQLDASAERGRARGGLAESRTSLALPLNCFLMRLLSMLGFIPRRLPSHVLSTPRLTCPPCGLKTVAPGGAGLLRSLDGRTCCSACCKGKGLVKRQRPGDSILKLPGGTRIRLPFLGPRCGPWCAPATGHVLLTLGSRVRGGGGAKRTAEGSYALISQNGRTVAGS